MKIVDMSETKKTNLIIFETYCIYLQLLTREAFLEYEIFSLVFNHFLDQKSAKVVFCGENAPARNAAVALEGLEANPAY